MISNDPYPLVNVRKKLWKINMSNRQIACLSIAMFNSYVTNYQRVGIKLVEHVGTGIFQISHVGQPFGYFMVL